MDNTGYPTDDRRDYDDRQKNYEGGNYSGGPRPRRNQEDGGFRRGYNSKDGGPHRPYNQGGYRSRPNYSGQQRGRAEDGWPRRNYSEDGWPRRNYSGDGGPRRNYSEDGDQRRPYNSEGPRRPYNGYGKPRSSAPHRYNSGEQDHSEDRPRGNRRPYNQNGYGKPRNSGRNGYGSNGPRRNYGVEEGQGSYGRPRGDKFTGGKGGMRPRKGPRPESGIDRMLSRKPLVDDKKFSDNDMVKLPIKAEVRLNKFIADSGICSRREADNFIVAGVVTVNGVVVTELGSKVNKFEDDVRFNGERLKGEAKVYIVMNKPKGYVTTTNDPHAEKTVMDLLKSCTARVTPVGRLDKNTTGVLMFTNDGEIAEKLTRPAYNKKKIYEVTLTSDLSQEDYEKILSGVPLSDGVVAADELEFVDENNRKKLGIEIHSGKNRIVRRIFEYFGYTVRGLDRVYFAGLTKKGIKRGAWRYLSEAEVNVLRMGAYN